MQIGFNGLLANTISAHIHCCTAVPLTGVSGVATQVPAFAGFPLGVTSGSYDQILDLTLSTTYNPSFVTARGSVDNARLALIAGLGNGTTYLNIHTTQFTGGEIRGFITTVPEPGTVALTAAGLLALGGVVRRRATRSGRA